MDNIIVFDFDGVLADTRDDMLAVARVVCEWMGYPCEPTPEDLEALDHMSFEELGKQLGIPAEKASEFAKRSFELFKKRPLPPHIFPGMKETLEKLAQTNRIGVLTGNTFQVVHDFLEHYSLSALVGALLSADTPGTRSGKLKEIVANLKQDGGEAFMVGDSVSDISAAREAAVKSIAVTWGHQSEQKLSSASPDYVVHSPEELRKLLLDDRDRASDEKSEN